MKLVILGTAQSMVSAPFDDQTWEIWACQPAIAHVECKRADRLFEFHEAAYSNDPAVKARMVKADVPVMMKSISPDIPKSERFPLEEMIAYYEASHCVGARYYTSTIALMLAYALYCGRQADTGEHYEHIALYGVHMSAEEEEYSKQRQAMEYWVGVANGLGVKIDLPVQSAICKSYRIYGYDAESAIVGDMRRQKAEIQGGINQAKRELDGKVQQLYELSGALKILEKMDREFS